MNDVNKWIEMGNEILVSLNKARAQMMATVDDLVEEGTLSREQGEKVLEAWKKKAANATDPATEEPVADSGSRLHESPLIQSLFDKWSNVAPASRDEVEELRRRIERLEELISQRNVE